MGTREHAIGLVGKTNKVTTEHTWFLSRLVLQPQSSALVFTSDMTSGFYSAVLTICRVLSFVKTGFLHVPQNCFFRKPFFLCLPTSYSIIMFEGFFFGHSINFIC